MHKSPQSVAVLIDGGFFLKRYGSIVDPKGIHTAEMVAKKLYSFAHGHAKGQNLYRIFYYDCSPFEKKVHNPITNKSFDFKRNPQYSFRMQLFEELKKKRKVALRLGVLKDSSDWILKPDATKLLLSGKISPSELTERDVVYNLRQKGIDMKIGIDIASMTSFQKNCNEQCIRTRSYHICICLFCDSPDSEKNENKTEKVLIPQPTFSH